MIVTNGTEIVCSYGDTFSCTWEVEGITIADNITFSIKMPKGSTDVLLSKKCEVLGRLITVDIPANEFAEKLPVGSYKYDLVMVVGETKTTLLFPANFYVKAVVHNE